MIILDIYIEGKAILVLVNTPPGRHTPSPSTTATPQQGLQLLQHWQ